MRDRRDVLSWVMAMSSQDPAPKAQSHDPLREQLLDAALRVFASRGYSGIKIMDIVKEAGLSSGAVYGRFNSKDELLMEAVTTRAVGRGRAEASQDHQVADMFVRVAERQGPLDNAEAIRLEAYVAARRAPEVAEAIKHSRKGWRKAVEPAIGRALADGTVPPDVDPDLLTFFIETVHLGLLLQRGAGLSPEDPEAWGEFVRGMLSHLPARCPKDTAQAEPTDSSKCTPKGESETS